MARYFQLQIPEACHEQWQHMIPQHDGRFCQSCQKLVTDFTQMRDEELIRYFQQYTGTSCGRFAEHQLNRDLQIPRKPIPWLKYFFRYSLPAFLLILKGNLQAQITSAPTEILPARPKEQMRYPSFIKQNIRGMVTDVTGKPLAAVSVTIKGTVAGTTTDSAGTYMLKNVGLPATVQFSYIGYESKEIQIDTSSTSSKVELQPSYTKLGEVTINSSITSMLQGRAGGFVVVTTKRIKATKALKVKKPEPTACNQTASFVVYPNPVSPGNAIHLLCSNMETGMYAIELVSVTGQVLQSKHLNYNPTDKSMSVPLSKVQTGLYILRLIHHTSGKQLSQQLLVKE